LVTDNAAVFIAGDTSLFASVSDESAIASGLLILAYAALVIALA
jgi:hypothetical protein